MPGDNVVAKRERGTLMQSPFTFRRYGQTGLEASELFAKTAAHMDDICVIRSMHTDLPAHPQALLQMNVGRISRGSRPWALGSLMDSVRKIEIYRALSLSVRVCRM